MHKFLEVGVASIGSGPTYHYIPTFDLKRSVCGLPTGGHSVSYVGEGINVVVCEKCVQIRREKLTKFIK